MVVMATDGRTFDPMVLGPTLDIDPNFCYFFLNFITKSELSYPLGKVSVLAYFLKNLPETILLPLCFEYKYIWRGTEIPVF